MNRLYLYGILAIALIVGYIWHRNQIYQEGVKAGQTECQQKVEQAKKAESDRQRDEADRLSKESRDNAKRLEHEIANLRQAKDSSGCYRTSQPPELKQRLRDEYERYRSP